MKVKNTQRRPMDVETGGKGPNVYLGPRETSRELTKAEMDSPQIKANVKRGLLVVVEDKPSKSARASEDARKEGEQA